MKQLVKQILPAPARSAVRRVLHSLRGAPAAPPAPVPTPVPTPVPDDLASLVPYTMSGYRALEKHYRLGEDVSLRKIPGALVECGVCDGGSAAAMAYGLGGSDREVWLYDSFQGLPPTTVEDGALAAKFVGACVGSEEKVCEALRLAHVSPERVVVRRGWFQDTFKEPLPAAIALLHLDCDWYESVMDSLVTFYDLVADGGVIVLDDFGHWEGCREAFYDFSHQRGIKPLVERFGHTQMFWVKGRGDNRAYAAKWDILDGVRSNSEWRPDAR